MQYCWIDFAFLDNNFASFYLFFIFQCKTRDPLRKKSSVIEPGEFAVKLSEAQCSDLFDLALIKIHLEYILFESGLTVFPNRN